MNKTKPLAGKTPLPIVRRTRMEVLKLWVAALRSGKYQQTEGELRGNGGFCCLGVVCDLARKDGGPAWDGESYMDEYGYLPEPIAQFLRLSRPLQAVLSDKNDRGATFQEIADCIERAYIKRRA